MPPQRTSERAHQLQRTGLPYWKALQHVRMLHEQPLFGPDDVTLKELAERQEVTDIYLLKDRTVACLNDDTWENYRPVLADRDHLDSIFISPAKMPGWDVAIVDDGDTVALRRRAQTGSLDQLVGCGMLTAEAATWLRETSRTGRNFIVVGPTGAGKTTVLRALCSEVGQHDRRAMVANSETDLRCVRESESDDDVIVRNVSDVNLDDIDILIVDNVRERGAYATLQAADVCQVMFTIHGSTSRSVESNVQLYARTPPSDGSADAKDLWDRFCPVVISVRRDVYKMGQSVRTVSEIVDTDADGRAQMVFCHDSDGNLRRV